MVGVVSERNFLRILAVLLSFIVAYLAWHVTSQDVHTRLVPPGLTEPVTVSDRHASPEYHRVWGVFMSTLLGNVTPDNAAFLTERLSPHFLSDTYHVVRDTIATQAEEIRQNKLAISFMQQAVSYERATGKTFVSGRSVARSAGGDESTDTITYEYQFVVRQGLPKVARFDVYPGPARTEQRLVSLRKKEDRR